MGCYNINNVEFIRSNIIFSELTIISGRCVRAQYIILNFGKTVATVFSVPKSRCFGFSFDRRVEEERATQPFKSVPAHHWHECSLVSVCACSCAYACVNENVREKECYEEMNVRNDIYILKKNKKKALSVDSVALRNTLVYVWETLP